VKSQGTKRSDTLGYDTIDEGTSDRSAEQPPRTLCKIYRVIWCKNGSTTPYDSIDGLVCQKSVASKGYSTRVLYVTLEEFALHLIDLLLKRFVYLLKMLNFCIQWNSLLFKE